MITVKALILDLHGMLISSFPYKEYVENVKKIIKKEKISLEYDLLILAYKTISYAMEIYNIRDKYLKMLDGLPIIEQEDEELYNMLKNSGLKLYIATDTSRSNCIKTLEVAGLEIELFDGIVTGNDVRLPKPETELYEKIIKDFNLNKEEILVFGDRTTDIIPAEKLGLKAVLGNKEILKWWLYANAKVRREDSN